MGCGVSVQMTHVLHSRWWNWNSLITPVGFPRGSDGKECETPRFDPWIRKIPWRTAWQPTLVFLPGESRGQRSLEGYSPWGRMDALSSNPSVTLDSSLFLTSIRQQVLSRLPQRPIFSLSTPLHPSFCHLLF